MNHPLVLFYALAFLCSWWPCASVVGTTPSKASRGAALEPDRVVQADVIVAGGSSAALAAAFAAAEEGAATVLLEPTDWIGGQLTSSGVPAVDEAWHRIVDRQTGEVLLDVSKIARDPANMTPDLREMLADLGNPGRGWVSRFCFDPRRLLERHLLPRAKRLQDKLTVFRNTVVKQLVVDEQRRVVCQLLAIQRRATPATTHKGYDVLPSEDLADWYDPRPSPRFNKQRLLFEAAADRKRPPVFIDATEWGELLVLSGGPYLQGVEDRDGGQTGDDRCGQATVFGFVQQLHDRPVTDPAPRPAVGNLGFGSYRDRPDAWPQIWTYRRLLGSGAEPAPGDLSLQNWGYALKLSEGGNDYPFGYLFLDKKTAAATRQDWQGGVDVAVMRAAEQRAFGWHQWFKAHAPHNIDPTCIALNGEVLGTGHGLAKLPYIRDTRRSVGLGGFVLPFADLIARLPAQTGSPFEDRIALGAYPADIHQLASCNYPDYIRTHIDTAPFFVPYRALTHVKFNNLLVAGKTMAQSFLANSATRLHPIEWSTGTAAGVVAAWMSAHNATSAEVPAAMAEVQARIRLRTPLEWTIDGKTYPALSPP